MKTKLMMEAPSESDARYFELDSFQTKVLNHKGNIALRCGRQTGKSTAVALKARKLAYEYEGSTTLILASSLRQAYLLYEKVRAMLEADNADEIKKQIGDKTFKSLQQKNLAYREAGIFLDKEPTKSRIRLKNGSQILVEPCGETGAKIRGYCVDFLIVDEAQEVPPMVWVAIIPMLATSAKMRKTGWIIILGTPKGRVGFFYDCFSDSEFKHIHVTADKCGRTTKKFLAREKKRLTKSQYLQEYMAEFVEAVRQYFPSELVDSCATLTEEKAKALGGKRFLGVDFARFGGDENAYVEALMDKSGKVYVVWADSKEGEAVTAPMGFIKNRDTQFSYNRIFIDSGGLGGSILDVLQETISKRRVVGLDNSQRRFQEEGEEKKAGILKEDLYMNVKILMEQGKLKFINNPLLIFGLKGVSFEYSKETGNVKIKGTGRGRHIVEAFVRACWCVKNRGLDIFLM